MRRGRRYSAHRNLLLTFLFFGSAGSFVLGQEVARGFAAVSVYAAQPVSFSGAGITASLITPLQASGAIGQRTPTPKVVKPHSKGLSSKPAAPPHAAPTKAPPVVLPGAPAPVVQPAPPCGSTPCDLGPHPAPPTAPAPGVVPVPAQGGLSLTPVADPASGVFSPPCAPLGLVTNPATAPLGALPAHCVPTRAIPTASSTETPKPAAPGAAETPALEPLSAPGTALAVKPAPDALTDALAVAPITTTDDTVAHTSIPSATGAISPAAVDRGSGSASGTPQTDITPTPTLDMSDQVAPLDPTAPATSQEQTTQP
jgi:hypothetical protein